MISAFSMLLIDALTGRVLTDRLCLIFLVHLWLNSELSFLIFQNTLCFAYKDTEKFPF